jgi:hypothetical protein
VTGISGGVGGATGPAGTSGTSGSAGTSGTSPSGGGGVITITNIETLVSDTIGASASSVDYSIAIGSNAKNLSLDIFGDPTTGVTSSVSLGTNTKTIGPFSVSIGSDNVAGQDGVSIGSNIINYRNYIPQPNSGIGKNLILSTDPYRGAVYYFGRNAQASSDGFSVLIGDTGTTYPTVATLGRHSVLVGGYPSNLAVNGINIGYENDSSGGNAIAIGRVVSVTHTNSVVLGVNLASVADAHAHIENLYIKSAPVYADNAAALTAGLVAGQVYRTSTGVLMITY